MASQILTRGHLEKMSNENLIVSFLALQDYTSATKWSVTTKQGHVEKVTGNNVQNWFTCKEKWTVDKSAVAQNTLKVLQEAFNATSSKLVELERKHHKLEQYSRRECLYFSSIPSSVSPKDLENFVLRLLQEISVDLEKSRIVACHRLGKMDRTIIKFLKAHSKVWDNFWHLKAFLKRWKMLFISP